MEPASFAMAISDFLPSMLCLAGAWFIVRILRLLGAGLALQLATVGIVAWFAFGEGAWMGGGLAVVSMLAMLAMGALASASVQARFADRIFMNWLDQTVNIAAQVAFLGAAVALWRRASRGHIAGVPKAKE